MLMLEKKTSKEEVTPSSWCGKPSGRPLCAPITKHFTRLHSFCPHNHFVEGETGLTEEIGRSMPKPC